MDQLLISIAPGVTDALGVSRRAVYRLINEGELTRVKIGTRALVTSSSVRDYVDRLTATAS
ncbi:excisionase [Mycobacterium paragordonae]|uniref:Helix-turn-helix domain-containing protein n=1 Tax=Mycobacterium paragordonae TaxID=1389713 RepID=A0ABQ1C432_9MYCO|nr:helix-turn-helix domain-containing protein [Mycobacterium paragordonae]AYE95811.1 excisionase [Mycobacterium paragordonae]GFG79100.1 hypothetical protein MPRG_23760 [Mycobacterium paragordonae]